MSVSQNDGKSCEMMPDYNGVIPALVRKYKTSVFNMLEKMFK